MLTVVTVVLAVLALIVGGAAIWGYNSLKGTAERKAHQSVSEFLKSKEFSEQVDLRLADRVQSLAKEAVQTALISSIVQSEQSRISDDAGTDGDSAPQETNGRHAQGDEEWED